MDTFKKELTELIHKHDLMRESGTPADILTSYLICHINIYNLTIRQREEWLTKEIEKRMINGDECEESFSVDNYIKHAADIKE